MKRTLVKVISSTMCALMAAMLPMYTAKAAGPEYEDVVMENSPRYFYVGEDYYRFELIFEGGLESYSWSYLETQPTVGIQVERIASTEASFPDDLLTNQEVKAIEITRLRNALAHIEDQENAETDWDGNGQFDIFDLVLAARKYANNPMNYLYGENMTLDNFVGLLNYYDELGETKFVVKPNDVVPAVTTEPVTTSETTTTMTQPVTTTAVAPKTTSTTTSTMTTSTTTSTTTTSTTTSTTTTSTTTSTTTTSTTTSTTTTSTTTSTTTTSTTTSTTTTSTTTSTTTTSTTTSTTTTSTTTSTTTTSTTTSTTTTSTTTSTTTTSTTTSMTTTSTTTSMTTTSTTTSATIEWTPPTQDDIGEEFGFAPSDEEYEGLVASAELFGLDYYKIIWTDELIEYSLVIPSNTYATIANLGDWICFQVCPIQDAEKILPEYNWKETGHNLAVWRPETDGINFNTCSKDLYWDGHYGFVIIPLKPNEEGQLVEDLRLLYPISE